MKSRPIKRRNSNEFRYWYKQGIGVFKGSSSGCWWLTRHKTISKSSFLLKDWLLFHNRGIEITEAQAAKYVLTGTI